LAVKESYDELTDQWLEDDYSIEITDDSKVIAGYKCNAFGVVLRLSLVWSDIR
jgi:hypothetical protein